MSKWLVLCLICFTVGFWLGGNFEELSIDGAQYRVQKSLDNRCELTRVELVLPRYTVVLDSPKLNDPYHIEYAHVMFFPDEIEYQVKATFADCPEIVSELRSSQRGGIYEESIKEETVAQYPRHAKGA